MEFLKVLTRNEMKNILGGTEPTSIDIEGCSYPSDGCSGVSGYYNCMMSQCNSWYYGTNLAQECTGTVGEQWQSRILLCGVDYS